MYGHSVELTEMIRLTEDQAESEGVATAETWAAVWRCKETGGEFLDRGSLADQRDETAERTGTHLDGYELARIVCFGISGFGRS